MEKVFVGFLGDLVKIIGDLADIFVKNQAWGVVAVLFVLLAAILYFVRKDRLTLDNRMSDLLETRNKQILTAFEKATSVADAMSDLEHRINVLDQRCDFRQKHGLHGRKGGQA